MPARDTSADSAIFVGVMELRKCGACSGCEAEAAVKHIIEEFDRTWYEPKLKDIQARLCGGGLRYPSPDDRRSALREAARFTEARDHYIQGVIGSFPWTGCFAPIIFVPKPDDQPLTDREVR